MDAKVIHGERMLLAGLSYYGDPFSRSAGWTEENEIGVLWKRFERTMATLPHALSLAEPDLACELHIPDADTPETGQYEVFIGCPVVAPDVPLSLVMKVVPASRYVVFHLAGREMVEDDTYLQMDQWISSHRHSRSGSWMINRYDHRFKGLDRVEESEMDVWIPIE